MRKNIFKNGFTLIELLLTMAIFTIGIMLVSKLFINHINLFRQQSTIMETNIEGIMGLEILRKDIESAGYGLPWNLTSGISYTAQETFPSLPCGSGTTADPTTFNDPPPQSPRAVVSGNNTCFNNSDYLVIKAISIAMNDTVKKWALLKDSGVLRDDLSGESFSSNERVIVIDPGTSDSNFKTLIGSGGVFYKPFNSVNDFKPSDTITTRLVYGLTPPTITPKVPFNRADYFIKRLSTIPSKCAPGTGVLYKATMNHGSTSGTNQFTELPILDCVADMQVIYCVDNDSDGDCEVSSGSSDNYTDDISLSDAKWIREKVKEVRVYILAQEGSKDLNYSYPNDSLFIGEFGLGHTIDLKSKIGNPEYKYYRWKIYKIVVKPNNLWG